VLFTDLKQSMTLLGQNKNILHNQCTTPPHAWNTRYFPVFEQIWTSKELNNSRVIYVFGLPLMSSIWQPVIQD